MPMPKLRVAVPLVLLSLAMAGCSRRQGGSRACDLPARGSCQGSIGGVNVSGPLDPESGWLLADGQAQQCGEDPLVMVLSCAGHQFRARAVYPHDSQPVAACGWSTDVPQAGPPVAQAVLYPLPERNLRTSGAVRVSFADGEQLAIDYDFADEAECEAANARVAQGVAQGVATGLEVLSGVVWVATLPGRIFSFHGSGNGGGSYSSSGHHSSGHHHHHH